MKNAFFLLIISATIVIAGCTKEKNIVANSPSSPIDIFSKISRDWKLMNYKIRTDKGSHSFSGAAISGHSLLSLKFHKDGQYVTTDNAWSGRFDFSKDSTEIILSPNDSHLFPLTFQIRQLSISDFQLSTPAVQVNPEKPDASDYESSIAFQGMNWLYNHNVNVTNIRSIQIIFFYRA
jgi:hypothetical protein